MHNKPISKSLRRSRQVVFFIVRWYMRFNRMRHRQHLIIRGLQNVPREGSVLLVANHAHRTIGPVLWSALKRNTTFFTAGGLNDELISWWLDWVGFFQVPLPYQDESQPERAQRIRTAATALQAASQTLAEGGAVGVFLFPNHPNQLSLPAIKRLARPGVTVVPVGITTDEDGNNVRINIGRGMTGNSGKGFIQQLCQRVDSLCEA